MSPPFPHPLPSPPSFFFSSHSLSGRAASEGPIPQGTAPAETGSGSSYNSEWIANHQGLRRHTGAASFPPQPPVLRSPLTLPQVVFFWVFFFAVLLSGASGAAGPELVQPGDLSRGRVWGWESWGCRSGLSEACVASPGVSAGGVCVSWGKPVPHCVQQPGLAGFSWNWCLEEQENLCLSSAECCEKLEAQRCSGSSDPKGKMGPRMFPALEQLGVEQPTSVVAKF